MVTPNQYDDDDAAPTRGGTSVCRHGGGDVDWWRNAHDDVHAARFAAPLPQPPRSSALPYRSTNDLNFAWRRAGAPAAVG